MCLKVANAVIGQYSVTARATIVVTAALSVIASALFLLYNSVMLTLIKRKHAKETRELKRSMGNAEGEGNLERVPGSGVLRTV